MHKNDFLKVYFMHHYGGGYTDVKHIHASWKPFFDQLYFSNKYAIGYPEKRRIDVACNDKDPRSNCVELRKAYL
jgi:hypothetical protein